MALFFFLVLSLCIPWYEVDARSKSQPDKQQSFTRSQILRSTLRSIDNEFECVDIYKQPAFQHPLLKNHKIQLNPTCASNTMRSRSSYFDEAFRDDNFTKGCPPGKVPIHKMKTKHQIITNSSSKSHTEFHPHSSRFPGQHFAILDTNQSMVFRGASALISSYSLALQENQYSISQISLQGGSSQDFFNSIQVGCGVHPNLYGDSQLRLTASWIVDGPQKYKCFNNQCPGFVQTSSLFGLGAIISPTSTIGSWKKYGIHINVYQEPSTGNWWLIVIRNFIQIRIGYWPKELFTHLSGGASWIGYGGETYAPSGMYSPPMGSGRLPRELFLNSSFIARLMIVDSEYHVIDVNPHYVEPNLDTRPDCYNLWYGYDQGPYYRQALLFGGPGGKCGV